MSPVLENKKIVCGITGSIAAYKVCDWIRSLRREGAEITAVLTDSATEFVTPLTFAALTGKPVYRKMFSGQNEERIPHISLARGCDLILVAPATAQTISRFAHGMADDLLAAIVMATEAKVVICPAMNSRMYLHPATQENIGKLKEYGYLVVEPDCGMMACGEEGPGRLPEWNQVREAIISTLTPQTLYGKTVLVTAGPTEEPFDPVRFIGNRSSGKMGYAMAAVACQMGARVILITGPGSLPAPAGVELVRVRTAEEMYMEVMSRFDTADIVVKAAAVSDFRPAEISSQKIKKTHEKITLQLIQNRDILQKLGEIKNRRINPPLLIGFAAESDHLVEYGQEKMQKKNLDFIAVNDITAADSGFAVDTNRIILLDRQGGQIEFPLLSKEETARRIWGRVVSRADRST